MAAPPDHSGCVVPWAHVTEGIAGRCYADLAQRGQVRRMPAGRVRRLPCLMDMVVAGSINCSRVGHGSLPEWLRSRQSFGSEMNHETTICLSWVDQIRDLLLQEARQGRDASNKPWPYLSVK